MIYVVAKYKEDISWSNGLNAYIYDKSKDIPNIGREAETYLRHILRYYDVLEGNIAFCQGNPFDHVADYLDVSKIPGYYGEEFVCDDDGAPNHTGLRLGKFYQLLFDNIPPKEYRFKAGANFTVTAEQIRARSYNFWLRAYAISVTDPLSPWKFERMWHIIFNVEN